MPSKQALLKALEALSRDDLMCMVDALGVDISGMPKSRHSRPTLVAAISSHKKLNFEVGFSALSRDALKKLCDLLELPAKGRSKQIFIDALLMASKKAAPKSPSKASAKKSRPKKVVETSEISEAPKPRPQDELLSLPLPGHENPSLLHPAKVRCAHCRKNLEVRKCQMQRCHTKIPVSFSSKICSECMFERNTLSMVDFNKKLLEETSCPHCHRSWLGQSATG